MPQLDEKEIRTREVLDWKGLHLLHFTGSSCSQKTRIFLNLKGIPWVSHPVNLVLQKNYTPWFLGINPRGLVPVLVHDGRVIIESNDILAYLEEILPEPPLIPDGKMAQAASLLQEEDDLHLDIRTLTMRFVFPEFMVRKNPSSLTTFAEDEGEIDGRRDPHKEVELRFWREMAEHGITDAQATEAAGNFRRHLQGLDARLAEHRFLLGDTLSVVDIAWYIYAHRLLAGGYPMARLHPKVETWYQGLHRKPEFRKEVLEPAPLVWFRKGFHLVQKMRGSTLPEVVGF